MTYVKQTLIGAALVLALSAPASAECYIDYKAKGTGDGLSLHYGVMQLSDDICDDKKAMQTAAERRLTDAGWKLLRIVSSFGEDRLSSKQEDAGDYFLRY